MKRRCLIKRELHIFLIASIVILNTSNVYSAGFQISEQSGTGLERAFAGFGVIGDDLSMAFYNTAGITLQHGTQVQLTGYFVDGKGRFQMRALHNVFLH